MMRKKIKVRNKILYLRYARLILFSNIAYNDCYRMDLEEGASNVSNNQLRRI